MNAPTPLDRLLLPEFDVAQLDALEEEAIFVLRETAAAFERPALLFSGGKDSCVVLHLAQKAFKLAGAQKARLPFPLLHVDTGHNFPEVIAFRDALVTESRAATSPISGLDRRGSVRLACPANRATAIRRDAAGTSTSPSTPSRGARATRKTRAQGTDPSTRHSAVAAEPRPSLLSSTRAHPASTFALPIINGPSSTSALIRRADRAAGLYDPHRRESVRRGPLFPFRRRHAAGANETVGRCRVRFRTSRHDLPLPPESLAANAPRSSANARVR